ncbi:RNA 2',3'-cyclic phosphodiesterase [Lutimaribacter sp. EGI FJ00015]|uniref:RNA 2',3'-cyclic phosphodiesterase n=1 Tax=Lutimaribacter degradans TaxID=2945989 RepID=A0ACC5ZQL3_9RHOB|nr:RNA 2',3'-cyclic phosphodiesterase [Lutimaribacter sp. EGI FJ00013]MCM2560588.1 RNA 2',3'-cyclic phosphodiesterase [Lutimaribacter sp. EGI FJ00013]MCO0612469.1 RNA 2',3'-cyclic phosphodiesterase [Lutimaribacter sp. EGI FJ00015]MCO0634412.1 RNA 2',3'-cyclic phosphodiesterase [Lutimaribacter sp. EGI FJ00014]
MRVFVGLPLPDAASEALEALQSDLRAGRHVPPENLHLTLAFLGEVTLPDLEALHLELQQVSWSPFELRLSGLELFGGPHPRALVIEARGGKPLRHLRDKIRSAARGIGLDLPRTRFRPHVTLARFPRDMSTQDATSLGRFLAAHGDAALPAMSVAGFALYRSHLARDGARYEVLADYPATA